MLPEFDLDIRDKKGTENVVVDHLSRLEYLKPDLIPINDEFTYDILIMEIRTNHYDDPYLYLKPGIEKALVLINVPWYTDFVNYLVADIIPPDLNYQQKKRFFHDIKHFYWDEPLLFKRGTEGIFHCCVP